MASRTCKASKSSSAVSLNPDSDTWSASGCTTIWVVLSNFIPAGRAAPIISPKVHM